MCRLGHGEDTLRLNATVLFATLCCFRLCCFRLCSFSVNPSRQAADEVIDVLVRRLENSSLLAFVFAFRT